MSTEDLKSDPLFESDNIILQVEQLPSTPAKVKLRQMFVQNGMFLVPEVNVSVSQGQDPFQNFMVDNADQNQT